MSEPALLITSLAGSVVSSATSWLHYYFKYKHKLFKCDMVTRCDVRKSQNWRRGYGAGVSGTSGAAFSVGALVGLDFDLSVLFYMHSNQHKTEGFQFFNILWKLLLLSTHQFIKRFQLKDRPSHSHQFFFSSADIKGSRRQKTEHKHMFNSRFFLWDH